MKFVIVTSYEEYLQIVNPLKTMLFAITRIFHSPLPKSKLGASLQQVNHYNEIKWHVFLDKYIFITVVINTHFGDTNYTTSNLDILLWMNNIYLNIFPKKVENLYVFQVCQFSSIEHITHTFHPNYHALTPDTDFLRLKKIDELEIYTIMNNKWNTLLQLELCCN